MQAYIGEEVESDPEEAAQLIVSYLEAGAPAHLKTKLELCETYEPRIFSHINGYHIADGFRLQVKKKGFGCFAASVDALKTWPHFLDHLSRSTVREAMEWQVAYFHGDDFFKTFLALEKGCPSLIDGTSPRLLASAFEQEISMGATEYFPDMMDALSRRPHLFDEAMSDAIFAAQKEYIEGSSFDIPECAQHVWESLDRFPFMHVGVLIAFRASVHSDIEKEAFRKLSRTLHRFKAVPEMFCYAENAAAEKGVFFAPEDELFDKAAGWKERPYMAVTLAKDEVVIYRNQHIYREKAQPVVPAIIDWLAERFEAEPGLRRFYAPALERLLNKAVAHPLLPKPLHPKMKDTAEAAERQLRSLGVKPSPA